MEYMQDMYDIRRNSERDGGRYIWENAHKKYHACASIHMLTMSPLLLIRDKELYTAQESQDP